MKRMLQQSARCSGLSVAQIEVALDASAVLEVGEAHSTQWQFFVVVAVLESRRGALEAMPILRGSGSATGDLAAC